MAPEKGFTVPPPATPAPRGSTLGQLWQVPCFLLGLLAVFAVWQIRPLWYDPVTVRLRHELNRARSQLQDPHAALNDLTVRLHEVLSHIDHLPDRAAETHLLLGSTYLRLAEQLPPERASTLWRKARCHLEQAEQLGVPETDRPTLQYRLGKAWFHTGGDVQRVIQYLSTTIDHVEDDRFTGYEILTQCYLRLPAPDLPAALRSNEKQLQLPTDDSRLVPARLLRGELLLRMQQREAARKVLLRIGSEAPSAVLARARYLRASSYQEEQAWAEAAKLWQEILTDQRQPPTNPGRILYFLGCCYRNLGRRDEAVQAWEKAVQHGGEDSQAAGLRLANVQVESRKFAAAREHYQRALANVLQPADYRNSLVPLAEAGSLLASDCRACKDAGSFEEAEALAQLHAKLATPAAAQVLMAQVLQAWAGAQHARAQQLKDAGRAQPEEEAARFHFRAAATAYEAAARATAGQPETSEWLWQAGACAMQGQAFELAIKAYEQLIKLRPPLDRLSEASYRCGEAHQALHQDGPAVASYQHCIETEGPFKYRARYQLALAEIARGNRLAAEEMLDQNLTLMGAEPDREAQEKTLYTLADLLFRRREFLLAADRWEQALRDYPVSPPALNARYQLGLCYRARAERDPQNPWPVDSPDIRSRYRRQFVWLEKAAAHFQKLVEDLQARQAAAPLPESEAKLLSQARFALAQCRYEQGHYAEAVPLYISLANQQPLRVDNLVAFKRLYFCYVGLLSQEKPEASLELAEHTLTEIRNVLKQLDESAFQGQPEKRPDWERWLKHQEDEVRSARRDPPPR